MRALEILPSYRNLRQAREGFFLPLGEGIHLLRDAATAVAVQKIVHRRDLTDT